MPNMTIYIAPGKEFLWKHGRIQAKMLGYSGIGEYLASLIWEDLERNNPRTFALVETERKSYEAGRKSIQSLIKAKGKKEA